MTFDFERKPEYFFDCAALLFQNLAKHKPFLRQLESLKENHSRILTAYSLHQITELLNELQSGKAPLDDQMAQDWKRAGEYFNELVTTVTEYWCKGTQWAVEHIDHIVRNPKEIAIGPMEATDRPHKTFKLEWDAELLLLLNKEEIKHYILGKFEPQWAEAERDLSEAGLTKARKRGSLEKHVRWVFKYIFQEKSWGEIAEEEGKEENDVYDIDTIRQAAYPISDLLGLRRPRRPGG